MNKDLYVGLMSGTSMDAIDAALIAINGVQVDLQQTSSSPIPQDIRTEMLALSTPAENELERAMALDVAMGRIFAKAVNELLQQSSIHASDIRAIGSHGQTLRHKPDGETPGTLQIGDPNIIAELTGITTVADFRRRDMAAGGQGAPLVPAFHEKVFRNNKNNRIIVNIGGIANITVLPKATDQATIGFDTGPGNLLMDSWTQQNNSEPFDKNGQWAASGTINDELVSMMLADPFFKQPVPKSSGRDYFNAGWLENILKEFSAVTPANVQASLCELTATSIADAIKDVCPKADGLYICGGGVHNKTLCKRLQQHLPEQRVASTNELGIDPDWVEAIAFAWLAKQTLEGLPGNVPTVTGAKHPVILGAIYPV
jgi:anhydro-N-acetylmuramic acid kinase